MLDNLDFFELVIQKTMLIYSQFESIIKTPSLKQFETTTNNLANLNFG